MEVSATSYYFYDPDGKVYEITGATSERQDDTS